MITISTTSRIGCESAENAGRDQSESRARELFPRQLNGHQKRRGIGRCVHVPFCALVFTRILVSYFAISTDEYAIILAGTTWLRPAKFLASASGIVNIKRRKQMTP